MWPLDLRVVGINLDSRANEATKKVREEISPLRCGSTHETCQDLIFDTVEDLQGGNEMVVMPRSNSLLYITHILCPP